jgi:transcriptional regulator with XRE-family HTH domain
VKASDLAERLGITNAQLARALGINVRTIYRWADGSSAPTGITLEVLCGIDDALEAGADASRIGREITCGVRALVSGRLLYEGKRK